MSLSALYHRLRLMPVPELRRRLYCRLVGDRLARRGDERRLERKLVGHELDRLLERPLGWEPAEGGELPMALSAALLAQADELLAGRWSVFGRAVDLGAPDCWRRDPAGAAVLRRTIWPGYQRSGGADLRSIWELNRLQFLVTLGRAWLLTGREQYAARARELIESWDRANPYLRTVNWTSGLEAAFRALSLALALNLIRDSSAGSDPAFRRKMGLLLALHGRYLETHLTAPATGFNHRLGEAAALAVLGSLAPLLPGAPRWRLEGSRVLEESLLRLVLTDGGPAEGSLHYLALVCRLALVADLLSGRGEGPVLSGQCRERLRAGYRYLAAVTGQGLAVSEFGDSDDAGLPAPPPTRGAGALPGGPEPALELPWG